MEEKTRLNEPCFFVFYAGVVFFRGGYVYSRTCFYTGYSAGAIFRRRYVYSRTCFPTGWTILLLFGECYTGRIVFLNIGCTLIPTLLTQLRLWSNLFAGWRNSFLDTLPAHQPICAYRASLVEQPPLKPLRSSSNIYSHWNHTTGWQSI